MSRARFEPVVELPPDWLGAVTVIVHEGNVVVIDDHPDDVAGDAPRLFLGVLDGAACWAVDLDGDGVPDVAVEQFRTMLVPLMGLHGQVDDLRADRRKVDGREDVLHAGRGVRRGTVAPCPCRHPLGNLCTSQFKLPSLGIGIGIGIGIDSVRTVSRPLAARFRYRPRPRSDSDATSVQRFPNGDCP